jgi:flagellin
MSLGVLNNISAVYAENALNNTSNSLSKTLQQLSSGSRINSGADDAAGLSLVDGLQANQSALTQSQTNAQEGVGLLQVADGALSQVTSLLNRAVTLATEAANGTLNSTQDMAANQEYQSILSEINNIGATTTYNNQTVFNSVTNIYTGDASSQGSSINSLNIRSLSSSNVGDTQGVMSYSNGQNNVFIDLSKGGVNASVNDSLGASTATTTIQVSYMTKGANGSAVQAQANISVGAGTSYDNTAQGLIDAINGAGLGITATFGTAQQAGSAAVSAAGAANTSGGGAADTGIIISGVGVGTGTTGAGEVGTITIDSSSTTLTGGTLSIVGSDGKTHNLTLGAANSTDTLANLAATVNAAGWGVTASVNSSGYLDGNATSTMLTFASANPGVTVSANSMTSSGTANLSGTPLTSGSFSNVIGTLTTSNANQAYTGGNLNLGPNVIALGTSGKTDNASDLVAYINAGNYGITASVDSAGKVVTFTSANASETFSSGATVGAGTVSATTNVANQSQIGTVGFTNGAAVAGDDTSGSISINGVGFNGGAGITLGDIADSITASNVGVSASVNSGSVTIGGTTYAAGTYMTLVSTNASTQGATITNSLDDATSSGIKFTQDTPSVTRSEYYSVGISGSIADTTTGGGTLNVDLVGNNNGTGGVATVSYSDAAGQSLAATDLLNQSDAQAALTALNSAIADVAAQDGYIGAQINTLNSVSTVISTQQQNVQAAQNAVQATDYAQAASNMSKYQILSQTGISALAQANSVQQEVLKLLQ